MRQTDYGVLDGSELYFHTAGEAAKRLYLYPLCCGRYVCDETYRMRRNNYDSFLLLYVKSGSGFLRVGREQTTLREGSAALVDCYAPHEYGTERGWEILWCHFDGECARKYDQEIRRLRREHIVPREPFALQRPLEKLLQAFADGQPLSDARVNLYLTQALTVFLTEEGERDAGAMEQVLAYVSTHFAESITLEQMAAMAMLSPFHFSRRFRKETGCSPHEYLVNVRMNAARYYLRSSDRQTREIAWRCGFASESAFCKSFRGRFGCTPSAYRAGRMEGKEEQP